MRFKIKNSSCKIYISFTRVLTDEFIVIDNIYSNFTRKIKIFPSFHFIIILRCIIYLIKLPYPYFILVYPVWNEIIKRDE